MQNQNITVFYTWKAKPGNLNDLKEIYNQVGQEMEANEPGTLKMNLFVDESNETIFVHDEFANGQAMGMHLGVTAAKHFPNLLEIAIPGTFYFCGDVPDDLKQAAIGMGLQAEFSQFISGFERA